MRTNGSAHDLPRSVLLAVWLDARPADGDPLDRALHAIELDDEPHTVAGWAEAETSLRDALSILIWADAHEAVSLEAANTRDTAVSPTQTHIRRSIQRLDRSNASRARRLRRGN